MNEEPVEVIYHEDPDIAAMVAKVAGTIGRRFSAFTSRHDLSQECWVWIYSHSAKMSEWESIDDAGVGMAKLKRALYHVATGYAQDQKAANLGYRADDNFHYKVGTLRAVLPEVFENGFDLSAEAYADFTDRAMWLDVVDALRALPEGDYRLVARVFTGSPDGDQIYAEIATETEITPAAVRSRVTRILMRMQRTLGGPAQDKEYRHRKVKSNAAAIAETRSQYDE